MLWIQGKGANRYYSLSQYKSLYLRPQAMDKMAPYQEDYVQLWRDFPISNCLIPLPTRHPLFQTIPIIELKDAKHGPHLGMIIIEPSRREISRIYTMPTTLYRDHSLGQDLFKLPFARNRILKKNLDTIWNDIFSYQIIPQEKNIDDMLYDLYILHLRSKILPRGTVRYGLLSPGKAVIELLSKDKDYQVELAITQKNGNIYSFVIKTEKSNPDSQKLRSKFFQNISFMPIDSSMGKILYTEFKQLNFARQVDQEGMLYLFSAWSQDLGNKDLVRDMVYYLERGKNNGEHLKTIYKFAFGRYGKTFTTRKSFDENDDPNMVLQRKIEIEDVDRRMEINNAPRVRPLGPELTSEERMNLYLKKAKEEGPAEESEDMTVH